jgi:regulator of CtrA degradation
MSELSHLHDSAPRAVSFAETFVGSEAFRALFREGMGLVEMTASYLDGPGREQAKKLDRFAALAYAAESMRLTTRLMQVASWLLLQRAVAEGELTPTEARQQKHKVKLSEQDTVAGPDNFAALPEDLRDLVSQSVRLQARIIHLDNLLEGRIEAVPAANAVAEQQNRLAAAFAGLTRLP